MEKYDFSFSVVVLAENNNPTILNPDFLIRTKIVPSDWALNEPPLTTPAFSRINYSTGVLFTVDPERFTVQDSAPGGEFFPVPEIAVKYIEKIPHVKYHSLGINFEKALMFPKVKSASEFQKLRFLKNGPWEMGGDLSDFATKFIYSFSDSQCNITFSSPVILKLPQYEGKPKDGLIISANFHRDFKKIKDHEERNKNIIEYIVRWEKDKSIFESITDKLIGEEQWLKKT